jgi:hypothetical protein
MVSKKTSQKFWGMNLVKEKILKIQQKVSRKSFKRAPAIFQRALHSDREWLYVWGRGKQPVGGSSSVLGHAGGSIEKRMLSLGERIFE